MTVDVESLRSRHFNIVPVRPRSKRALDGWKQYQTEWCSEDVPDGWNAAVICGETSDNLYVVDLDAAELYPVMSEYHDTYTVKSRRGYHLYFKWGRTPVNKSFKFFDPSGREIDVKAQGGYVMAPGSIHPDEDITYSVFKDAPVRTVEWPEIERVLRAAGFGNKGASIRDIEGGLKKGDRNQGLFKYARYLISKFGLDGEYLLMELRKVNEKSEDGGIDDSEVITIAQSAPNYASPGFTIDIGEILDFKQTIKDNIDSAAAEVDIMQFAPNIGKFGVKAIIAAVKEVAPAAVIRCGGDRLMRDIKPAGYGKPEAFNGMVISADNERTYVVEGVAACPRCNKTDVLKTDKFQTIRLPRCGDCNIDYEIDEAESTRNFKKRIVIQELLEEAAENDPVEYEAMVLDDDVKRVHVGDRLRFIARFRSEHDKKRGDSRILFEVMGIFPEDVAGDIMPSAEEVAEWKQGGVYDRVIESFAPNIVLPPELKEAIAYALRGGKMKPVRGIPRERIHLLLMGDPSAGKTALIEEAMEYLPGSSYNDSTNVSAVGLTIGMKTMKDGTHAARAGLLPMHHGNVIALDEIDKMDAKHRDFMLTCMESGYVTMAKIGTLSKVRAEVGIICGGNPRNGRFSGGNVADSFGLTAAFMSRFDTSWLVVDKNLPEVDDEIAQRAQSDTPPPMDRAALRRYFTYVRTLDPEIPRSMWPAINDLYKEMRNVTRGKDIDISQRQRHGLYRMVAASAAMNLREAAAAEDLDNVKRVTRAWLATFGDYDLIPADDAKEAKIAYIMDKYPDGITSDELDKELADASGWNPLETAAVITAMFKAGRIFSKEGKYHLKSRKGNS